MIIAFPIPGYIAKLTRDVQVEKMKKVRSINIGYLSIFNILQSDARVQTVTESKLQ